YCHSSSNARLLHPSPTRRSSDLLGASVALVPAGRDNPFGHPTDELLEMLDDPGTTAVRTDVHGTVILPAEDPSVPRRDPRRAGRSEEHTSELQSRFDLVCRLVHD